MKPYSRRALLATLAAAIGLQACAKQHGGYDLTHRPSHASQPDAEVASVDAAAESHAAGNPATRDERDASALQPQAADAGRQTDDARAAPDREVPEQASIRGIEVWVGTLRHAVVAGVSDVGTGFPTPRDVDAVLLLNDDPDGQLVSGSIALGTASEAPTLHALPAGNTSTPFWYAAQYGLVEGFDYQMLSIQRSAIRLRFLLSAGQLWQSWCCDAGGTFDCPAQVAVASPAHGAPTARSCIDLSPTQSFDLRIEGDTMEGTIAPAAADFTPAVLRVRRMH